MTKEEIKSKVDVVFESVLKHTNFQLEPSTTAHDVDGWDSVTHILIITEIENTFGIKFDLMKLLGLENVGDLLNAIAEELE